MIFLHYNATTVGAMYRQFSPIAMAVLLVVGCSGRSVLNVHRPPIEQGNLYEQKHVDQLKIDMSKEQVLYIMGTPMLQDPFNRSRWDYYYSYANRRNQVVKKHHLVLHFDGNTLVEIDEVIPLPEGARSRRAETEHESRKRADDALLLDR